MKLLIVEDEAMTREGLVRTVRWPSLGIDACLVAATAAQGLCILRGEMPDILLCDIRMPGMNGIEMAKNARVLQPDCQIIMMSGYNDRQYIKDAIDLQAVAFLDKPIRIEILENAVREAVARSLQAKQSDRIVYLRQRDDFARHLLYGLPIDEELARRVGPDGAEGRFYSLLVHPLQRDRQFLFDLTDALGLWGVSTPDEDGNDAVFLKTETAQSLRDLLKAVTGGPTRNRVAVGNPFVDLSDAARSYASAKAAFSTMFYRAHVDLAYASDEEKALDLVPYGEEFRSLLLLSREKALLFLERFRDALMQHTMTPVDLVKSHYYAMAAQILSGDEASLSALLDELAGESLWDACARARTLDELERVIWTAFHVMEKRNEEQDCSYIVQEAKKYIQRNYLHAELSLEDIACNAHMSAGHLSVLFKNATGYTLHQYITKCRMERACSLLLKTHLKNQEIAEQIGIKNGNYFNRVFTSEIGMTPQTYRKQYR